MKCGQRSSGGSFAASIAAMNRSQARMRLGEIRRQRMQRRLAIGDDGHLRRVAAVGDLGETRDQRGELGEVVAQISSAAAGGTAPPNSTPRSDSRSPIAIAARSASSGDAYGNPRRA